MKIFLKTIMAAVFFIGSFAVAAQQGEPQAKMADLMRSEGRIYVVVAVILTIFAGLILYLVRLDRKISKLEKQS
jgi:hypothetical protein